MKLVAMAASFPSGPRGQAVEPYYPGDIAAAVTSIAEAVLRTGAGLLFGAHPTISPIVLQTADLLNAGKQVKIFQSEFFANFETAEVRELVLDHDASIVRIPSGADEAASLSALREALLGGPLVGCFFCGGMDGLVEEFQIAGRNKVRRFVLSEPGGMAAKLPQSPGSEILRGRAYGSLVLSALEAVGLRTPRPMGPHETEMSPRPDGS